MPEANPRKPVDRRSHPISMTDGLHGASDHGVSWAVYLADPDGNGIELAWDKPENEWPWHDNRIRMLTRALPLRGQLAAHLKFGQ